MCKFLLLCILLAVIQILVGRLFNLRCKVLLCIFNERAVADKFPLFSFNTFCICSHSKRFTDSGLFSRACFVLPSFLNKA